MVLSYSFHTTIAGWGVPLRFGVYETCVAVSQSWLMLLWFSVHLNEAAFLSYSRVKNGSKKGQDAY